jgi:hypothetical protein
MFNEISPKDIAYLLKLLWVLGPIVLIIVLFSKAKTSEFHCILKSGRTIRFTIDSANSSDIRVKNRRLK